MKHNILTRAIVAAGCIAAFSACDEDAWNKENLDGYESEKKPTVVETREYTLTDADYGNIASLSANKALAEAGGYSDQLAALPNTLAFTGDLNPEKLIPAFLSTQNFPYYILNDGSYAKVTYNVAAEADPAVTGASSAKTLTVGEDTYANTVWESHENYINAFAPSKQPSRYLPGILKTEFPDAVSGDYVVVTYDMASQEPVFGNVGGGEEKPEVFEMTSLLGDVTDNTDYEICGVVTGICNCGFTITDKTGTVLVYMGNGYDGTTYPIGTQLKVAATTGAYKGLMQLKNAEITVMGQQEYTYPTPTVYDRAGLDAVMNSINDKSFTYVQISGKVSVSGNNVNINLDGDGTAVGSIYYATAEQKALATDGSEVIVRGWLAYLSGSKYCNIIAVSIESAINPDAKTMSRAAAVTVPTEQQNAMYVFDGSRWSAAADFTVLNPADYTAMGQTYGNLSGTTPATLLPIYLKDKYPYAQAEAVKYVVYKYYDSASKTTTNRVSKYTFDGSAWTAASNLATATSQFVKVDGEWKFDPSVVLTLTTSRNDATSTAYYTACVDYVRDIVPDGAKYVTSYGNNEYWAGASWYQNNIDLRPGKAREQYAEGWERYDNDQLVETMKKRFVEESLLYALTKLNPDAQTNPEVDVFYTVNFYAYTGVTTGPHAAKYRVTGPGQFEFVEVKWNM